MVNKIEDVMDLIYNLCIRLDLLSKADYVAFKIYILSLCVFPWNPTHNLCATNPQPILYILSYMLNTFSLDLFLSSGVVCILHSGSILSKDKIIFMPVGCILDNR